MGARGWRWNTTSVDAHATHVSEASCPCTTLDVLTERQGAGE